VDADVPAALHSVTGLQGQRRLYSSRGLGNIIRGFVSMPDGDFSQVVKGVGCEEGHVSLDDIMALDEETEGAMDVEGIGACIEGSGAEVSRKEEKKKRQTAVWVNEVIPAMVQPYLKLLCDTESLRCLPPVRNVSSCGGCMVGRVVDVYCVFFDRKWFGLYLWLDSD